MSDVQKFSHWYFDEFQLDPLFQAMVETVEDSPWHRERNVGTHTDMVVSQYIARQQALTFDVLGAIGCAFHDVGKPSSEIIKFKPERGEYRAYHGHELVSARMWEDWAVRNWTFLSEEFGLIPEHIYHIGWMIEHHVPWATKKDAKLDAFAATAFSTIGVDSNTWIDMLMADQTGRMSDDSHQRIAECEEWICDHMLRVRKAEHRWVPFGNNVVYMLIGPPGCGKSTFREEHVRRCEQIGHKTAVVSMDDLRLEWYSPEYDIAFKKASEDSAFNAKVDKVYVEALRENNIIILDNTNTAGRARKRWLAPARARDFKVHAVLFPSTREQVLMRQHSREDKTIPAHVVENMYDRLSLPLIGDFDEVSVHAGNLPT